ncbi:hypothetical protein SALBM311S_04905 [Streptomyces alboniger]
MCTGIVKHLAGEARKPGSYSLHRVSGGAKRQEALQAKRGEGPAIAERAAQLEHPSNGRRRLGLSRRCAARCPHVGRLFEKPEPPCATQGENP